MDTVDKIVEDENPDVKLVFTSELALKRSIRKKYPLRGYTQERKQEIWDATFDDNKRWLGMTPKDMEDYLDKQWEEYKSNNI